MPAGGLLPVGAQPLPLIVQQYLLTAQELLLGSLQLLLGAHRWTWHHAPSDPVLSHVCRRSNCSERHHQERAYSSTPVVLLCADRWPTDQTQGLWRGLNSNHTVGVLFTRSRVVDQIRRQLTRKVRITRTSGTAASTIIPLPRNTTCTDRKRFSLTVFASNVPLSVLNAPSCIVRACCLHSMLALRVASK